jgi:hypothetical protein
MDQLAVQLWVLGVLLLCLTLRPGPLPERSA